MWSFVKKYSKNKEKDKSEYIYINASNLMKYTVFEMRHHYPCYPQWIKFLNEYLGKHDLKSFFINIEKMTLEYLENSQYQFAFETPNLIPNSEHNYIKLNANFEEVWFADLLIFLLQKYQAEINRLYHTNHQGQLFITLKNNGYLVKHNNDILLKLNRVTLEMFLCLLCDVLSGELGYHTKNNELSQELGHFAEVLEHQIMMNRNDNIIALLSS